MPGSFKDSISSGVSYYSDPYRMDHSIVSGQAKLRQTRLGKVDTIETKQQRLERQVQTQFQVNLKLPEGSRIIAVAQVSRYLVLALVVPPYYLAYEGPKWVLLQIMPIIELSIDKMGQFLFFITTSMVDIWAGFGKQGERLLKKPKNFMKKLNEVLNERIGKFQEKFKLAFDKIKIPLNLTLKNIERGLLALQQTIAWVNQKAIQLQKFLKVKVAELKSRSPELFKKIAAGLAKVIDPIIFAIQKALVVAAKPIIYVSKKVASHVVKVVKAISSPVQAFIREKIAAPLKVAAQTVSNAVSKAVYKVVVNPINGVIVKVKEIIKLYQSFVESKVQSVSAMAKSIALGVVLPLQKFGFKLALKTHEGAINLAQKTREVFKRLKVIQPIFKSAFNTLLDKGKKHGGYVLKQGGKLARLIQAQLMAALLITADKMRKFPAWFGKLWMKFKAWAIKAAKNAVLAARLILAWTKVLVRYSLKNLWT